MQRGCVSTLAASTKMARERAAGSEMAANADGGCNVLESCAEAETDTAPAMQHSNATTDPARMRPYASDREITFPSGKSSHGETMHPNATSLTRLRCIGAPPEWICFCPGLSYLFAAGTSVSPHSSCFEAGYGTVR